MFIVVCTCARYVYCGVYILCLRCCLHVMFTVVCIGVCTCYAYCGVCTGVCVHVVFTVVFVQVCVYMLWLLWYVQVLLKLCTNAISWNPMEAFTFTAANDDFKLVDVC